MLASLVIDRDPTRLEDFLPRGLDNPGLIGSWIQDAGGFAAAGLVIWLVVSLLSRSGTTSRRPAWQSMILYGGLLGAALAYGVLFLVRLPDLLQSLATLFDPTQSPPIPETPARQRLNEICLTVGGLCALIAAGLPFVLDLFRLSPRRIGALARLSFKEAVRRRVLWIFFALLLVVLFPAQWWDPSLKPENEVRTNVRVAYSSLTLLLLFVFSLVAALSIPADITKQTIHTVVTKPVERFEIVLGRFLGYNLLMSCVLVTMTAVGLGLLMYTGVSPEAKEESFKARVPLFGDLEFLGTQDRTKGVNVGKLWEYRTYIRGPGQPEQTAIWTFRDLPRNLADRSMVRCEFDFDIYRTYKGSTAEEDRGLPISLFFETQHWTRAHERDHERDKKSLSGEDAANRLAAKYGYFEVLGLPIVNQHTFFVDVPAGLVQNAFAEPLQTDSAIRPESGPLLRVRVKCDSPSQYIGMAKHDLYFRLDDPAGGEDYHAWQFALNYFKGAFGVWLLLGLVIGLAVALSTQLSGVVAWLGTLFLLVAGLLREFMTEIVSGKSFGGGPMESFVHLVSRETGATPLEPTATGRLALGSDRVYRWLLRRCLDVFPDVHQFFWGNYVAEGFSISWTQLLVHLILLIGYLLPWAVLAYYVMKSREMAAT